MIVLYVIISFVYFVECLFAEKLRFSSINICFPEYTGKLNFRFFIRIISTSVLGLNTYEPSLNYIQEQFEKVDVREKINGHQRELYTHITCATDTETMQFVFDAISDMIIQTNLIHAGIF
jgi:guanine nucleotide-binding protein G(o) subunit alpha